jgi:hypothetical protein
MLTGLRRENGAEKAAQLAADEPECHHFGAGDAIVRHAQLPLRLKVQ